jgi:hypothetical protein
MALYDLSSLQKKAVARIMLDIANADGIITKEERIIFKTMEAFDFFSESEIEEAKRMSVLHCLSIIRNFSTSDKESLFEYMMTLSDVDGWHEKEVRVLLTICEGADIPLPDEIAKYL